MSTAPADIQLMDMVTGHLEYVGFASADFEFPFAREVTTLARLVVSRARGDRCISKQTLADSHPTCQLEALGTGAEASLQFDAASSDNVMLAPPLASCLTCSTNSPSCFIQWILIRKSGDRCCIGRTWTRRFSAMCWEILARISRRTGSCDSSRRHGLGVTTTMSPCRTGVGTQHSRSLSSCQIVSSKHIHVLTRYC